MNIVCSICARGGSKGLVNKNITPLLGKPLISWSIEQATETNLFSDIFVSTDSLAIQSVARDSGASVPFTRPSHLADDSAGKWEVWQHALIEYEKVSGKKVDVMVDLDCTSPLREVEDIRRAVALFLESRADLVFSVCEARKNPYFNLVEYKNGRLERSKILGRPIVRRQDAPAVYEHVASIYVIEREYLLEAKDMLEGNVIGYDVGQAKSFDVDSALDLKIITMLMTEKDR